MINDTKGCKLIKSKMMTDDFKEAYKMGRAALYILDLGWESNMMVFVIYGVSGGGGNSTEENGSPDRYDHQRKSETPIHGHHDSR